MNKDPKLNAPRLAEELFEKTGKKVHSDIVRRMLNESGYNGGVPRKNPYINDVNRKKRLLFAKEYISKEETCWKTVIFADESKFNIFGSNGRKLIGMA